MKMSAYFGPALGVLGGVMAIIGSLMPWATVQSFLGTVTVPGTDGDGIITLFWGVAVAAGAVTTALFPRLWICIVAAVSAVGLGAVTLFEIATLTSELQDAGSGLARASAGSGLYVLLLGSAAAVFGAVIHLGLRPAR